MNLVPGSTAVELVEVDPLKPGAATPPVDKYGDKNMEIIRIIQPNHTLIHSQARMVNIHQYSRNVSIVYTILIIPHRIHGAGIYANIKGVYSWDPWHTIFFAYMDPMGLIHSLVGGWALPLWKMMEFVSWDDEKIPIYMENHKIHVPDYQPVVLVMPHFMFSALPFARCVNQWMTPLVVWTIFKNDGVRQWGWDDIPYMKWKRKIFETTKQP